MVYTNSEEETMIRFPDYITANSKKLMSPIIYCNAAAAGPWKNAVGSGIMPTPNADVLRFLEQGLAEFLSKQKPLTPENWDKFISDFLRIGGEGWNEEGIEFAESQNLVII